MFVIEEYQYAALTKIYLGLIIVNCHWGIADNFTDINLPEEHMPYYFNSYRDIAEKCKLEATCPYKVSIDLNDIELCFQIFEAMCQVCNFCTNIIYCSKPVRGGKIHIISEKDKIHSNFF
jgi:hypothetical protein